MSGHKRAVTRPEGGLEDLDGAALSYAAQIAERPVAERQGLREDLVQLALPFAGRLARRSKTWSRWPASAWSRRSTATIRSAARSPRTPR